MGGATVRELSGELKELLQGDFIKFGLELSDLYINFITPPPEEHVSH